MVAPVGRTPDSSSCCPRACTRCARERCLPARVESPPGPAIAGRIDPVRDGAERFTDEESLAPIACPTKLGSGEAVPMCATRPKPSSQRWRRRCKPPGSTADKGPLTALARPSTNHQGTPFVAGIATVCGPISGDLGGTRVSGRTFHSDDDQILDAEPARLRYRSGRRPRQTVGHLDSPSVCLQRSGRLPPRHRAYIVLAASGEAGSNIHRSRRHQIFTAMPANVIRSGRLGRSSLSERR
ncbi:MAG: hypothetical protein JWQ73_1620 [Variovorax sp.]|jgi:hypothetical protein|nr:hypothetical protein [Variovorax sp.]